MDNLWGKQNATIKVKSGSCWGKENWKERLEVSSALHKSKLLELTQWSIALTRPVKLHVAGFAINVESIIHIISTCPNLAKNQYQKRYDKVVKKIHWLLWKKFHREYNDKWYEHVPNSVLENEECEILRNFPIQCDKVIEQWWPGIVCINKIAKSLIV